MISLFPDLFFHLDPRSHSLVTRFPGLRFELSSLLPPSFCQTYPPLILILILILSMSGHFSFINRKRIAPDRTISAHSLRWRRTISHSLSLSLPFAAQRLSVLSRCYVIVRQDELTVSLEISAGVQALQSESRVA